MYQIKEFYSMGEGFLALIMLFGVLIVYFWVYGVLLGFGILMIITYLRWKYDS